MNDIFERSPDDTGMSWLARDLNRHLKHAVVIHYEEQPKPLSTDPEALVADLDHERKEDAALVLRMIRRQVEEHLGRTLNEAEWNRYQQVDADNIKRITDELYQNLVEQSDRPGETLVFYFTNKQDANAAYNLLRPMDADIHKSSLRETIINPKTGKSYVDHDPVILETHDYANVVLNTLRTTHNEIGREDNFLSFVIGNTDLVHQLADKLHSFDLIKVEGYTPDKETGKRIVESLDNAAIAYSEQRRAGKGRVR